MANPEERDRQNNSSAERSADMYVDAVNAVIGLAGMAVPLLVTVERLLPWRAL